MLYSQDFVVKTLHEAAKNYDAEQVGSLLTNWRYKGDIAEKSSALHVLLSDGFQGHMNEDAMLECMKKLIASGCDVNAKVNGESPLSLAVHHGFEGAAHILVQNGADTAVRSKLFEEAHSLATEIARTMPNVMMRVLDSGVNWSKGETEITLDWGPILQYSSDDKGEQFGIQNHKFLQKETSFLHSLLEVTKPDENRSRFLTHPLVSAFLHLKACTVPKWQPLLKFGLTTFPLFYMLYVYILYFVLCKMDSPVEEWERCPSSNTSERISAPEKVIKPRAIMDNDIRVTCKVATFYGYVAGLLILCFIGAAVFELYKLLIVSTTYIKSWRSWLTLISNIVTACTLWPGIHSQFKDPYEITWQYPVVAVGIFLGWVLFLIQMEWIPVFKVYLEMLVQIIVRVVKIIALFTPIIFGFYMAFDLLYIEFWHIMNFLMMIVDIGSVDFFCNEKQDSTWYRLIAYGFTAMFILLIGIVFVNFMLGASISDIQKLKYSAKITNLSQKVLNHYLMDLMDLFSKKSYCVVSLENIKAKNWCFKFSPNDNYGKATRKQKRHFFYMLVPSCINWSLCKTPDSKLPKEITDSLIKLLKSKVLAEPHGHSSQTGRIDRLEGKINSITDIISKIGSDDQAVLAETSAKHNNHIIASV